MIPHTVSKEVRGLIHPSMSETAIVKKLRKDPRLLVKFFLQATQSLLWIKKYESFYVKILTEITSCAVYQTVPLNCLQITDSLFRRNIFESNSIKFDKDVFFSPLMLMRECLHLRELFYQQPDTLLQASKFAFYISLEQAMALSDTMFTHDFHVFLKESCETIQRLLLQSKAWGYERGVKAIQDLLSEYIDDIASLFGLYLFSTDHDFERLASYCLTALKNADLYESFDASGQRSLCHYELFNDLFTFTENHVLNRHTKRLRFDSYWEYPANSKGLIIKEVKFTFSSDGVIVSQTFFDEIDFEKRKEEISRLKRASLKREQVKMLTADGRNKVSLGSLCGMLRYFEACSILKLKSYGEITCDQLKALSSAKSNLTALIIDDSKVENKALNEAASLFPFLKAFTINHQDLTKENLAFLMRSEIDHLSLSYNRVEIPENLNDFSKLLYFGINHVKIESKEELKRLLYALIKLRVLHAIKTEYFSLECISHPEHLEEIMVDCDLIDDFSQRDDLSFLDPFQKLKIFSLYGVISSDMKRFLIRCMRERPNISFKFFPPRVKV